MFIIVQAVGLKDKIYNGERDLSITRCADIDVRKGIEIAIYLNAGLKDEDLVALAIGNLAAYRLQKDRGEQLKWQVLHVGGSSGHHFRLIFHHPERILDMGSRPTFREFSRTFQTRRWTNYGRNVSFGTARGAQADALAACQGRG